MARRWTDSEWDVLFAGYPLDAPHRPDRAACVALARRLDRTAEAVRAMWDDAAQWQRGLASSAASQRLKDYLLRHQ